MLLTAALIDIGDPLARAAARSALVRMRDQIDGGSPAEALEACVHLYGRARRNCLADVASQAATVAALAYHHLGEAELTARWARQAVNVVPQPELFAWTPLAYALAAIGDVGRGDSVGALTAVTEALRLLAVGGTDDDRHLVRALAATVCQRL